MHAMCDIKMRGMPLLFAGTLYFPAGICLQVQMNMKWRTTSDGVLVVFQSCFERFVDTCIRGFTYMSS